MQEGPLEPAQLRISDQERHQVAEVLRQAAGEGRIDLDELDERLEATFAARTYADLVPITADLPATGPASRPVNRPAGHVVAGPSYTSSFAMMSETKRSGPWQVGASHSAFALMGSVVIDLRQAIFTSREVVINASTLMGGVEVIVNPQTVVVCDGMGIMGDYSESKPRAAAETTIESPVVRVKGVAIMGAVNVKRKPLPGEPRRPRLSR
ncbi:MAG TPA: DUF1707 domain-containing protein [Nocardioidaceae bacterium]|nr:DUF1707 domain-containing protein [Nocardioidaceae bacterium]